MMLLRLSVLLLTLSAVHCGIFDGIRNCRQIRCYTMVGPGYKPGAGSVTVGSWSRKLCGHSCGTVQRNTPGECTGSLQSPSDAAMCNSRTFRYGSGSANAKLITATVTGKPDCRDG